MNKWLLDSEKKLLEICYEESKWDQIHNSGYLIWSVSSDTKLQKKIIFELKNISHNKILILGCGSNVSLQNKICEQIQDIKEVVCTDFHTPIQIAKKQKNNDKIIYIAMDSRNLILEDEFDVVISVNSILSPIDIDNRKMIHSCYRALKSEGVMLGLFPTILCKIETESIERKFNRLKRKLLQNKTYEDLIEKMTLGDQLFYSPLFLRRIFIEKHFQIKNFEIFFFDSDEAKAQTKKYYVITDEDILIYEFFLVANKS
jgi:Methyltransferase domain.